MSVRSEYRTDSCFRIELDRIDEEGDVLKHQKLDFEWGVKLGRTHKEADYFYEHIATLADRYSLPAVDLVLGKHLPALRMTTPLTAGFQ